MSTELPPSAGQDERDEDDAKMGDGVSGEGKMAPAGSEPGALEEDAGPSVDDAPPAAAPDAPLPTCDFAVVGGGAAGSLCAYFLRRMHPGKRVVLFSGGGRLGGCQYEAPQGNAAAWRRPEHGGLRLHRRAHQLCAGLAGVLRIATKPVAAASDGFFHRPGGADFPPTRMSGGDAARAAEALEGSLAALVSEFPEERDRPPFKSPRLRGMTLGQFLGRYCAAPDRPLVRAFLGTDMYDVPSVSLASVVSDWQLHGAPGPCTAVPAKTTAPSAERSWQQASDVVDLAERGTPQTFQNVCEKLVESSECEVLLGHRVTHITVDGEEGGNASALTDASAPKTLHFEGVNGAWVANHVVLALGQSQALTICGGGLGDAAGGAAGGRVWRATDQRIEALAAPVPVARLRVFLRFPKPWWTGLGLRGGESITHLSIRRVRYHNRGIIAVHCEVRCFVFCWCVSVGCY